LLEQLGYVLTKNPASLQICPPWLVDCGDTCNMPGVTCSEKAKVLCPVAPLTGAHTGLQLLALFWLENAVVLKSLNGALFEEPQQLLQQLKGLGMG
jgi:hypothetical protein